MKLGFHCNHWLILSSLIYLGVFTTGMWAHLDQLGVGAWSVLIISLAICYLGSRNLGPFNFYASTIPSKKTPPKKLSAPLLATSPQSYLILATALSIPLALTYLRSLSFEFPFSGDHDHHLMASVQAKNFWTSNWYWLALFAGFLTFGFTNRAPNWWPWLGIPLLFVASNAAQIPPHYFERYPATAYLLNVPFLMIGDFFSIANLLNAAKFANVIALPLWLFVLRPLMFGKDLTGSWLILGIFTALYHSSLYHFSSVYLEPWSIILLLLCIEGLFTENLSPFVIILLAGFACVVKDLAVLNFPILALAAWLRCKQPKDRLACILASVASLAPFIIYYLARQRAGVWRTAELVGFAEAFSDRRLSLMGFRLVHEFSWLGIFLILALISAALFMTFRQGHWRSPAIILFFGGLAQIWFFAVDRISQDYPLFPRLHWSAYIFLLSPLLALPLLVTRKLWLTSIAGLILALTPTLLRHFSQIVQPSYALSFTEDYAVPYYYPIRELVNRGHGEGLLHSGQKIRLHQVSTGAHFSVFPLVYRDLLKMNGFELISLSAPIEACSCQDQYAHLVPTPFSMNLNKNFPFPAYDSKIFAISEDCLTRLKATCARCLEAKIGSNESAGLICSN